MNLDFFNGYLNVIVVGICLCAGFVVKYAIPNDKINKFIPLINGALGLFINVWINNWAISAEIVLGGVFSGLASTGLYEAFAQFLKNAVKKNG